MGTPTTNFALTKPTVGADDDAWGGMMNANMDSIDNLLFLRALRQGGNRNLLVNPALQIGQDGFVDTTADSTFLADQWAMYYFTGATMRGQLVASVTPRGSANRLRMTVNAADTSITNDYVYFQQGIEGLMIANARWGSAAAMPMVLRFGWRGPAGNYGVTLRNNDFNRTLTIPFTVTAPQANTDLEFEMAIPGDTTGTWPVSNGRALSVSWVVVAGVTTATTGAWVAGNFAGPTGISNGTSATGRVYELFDTGLYLDPTGSGKAPFYDPPFIHEEYLRCFRYYYKDFTIGGSPIGASFTSGFTVPRLPILMRTNPTVAFRDSIGNPSRVSGTGTNGIVLSAGSIGASFDSITADFIANVAMATSGGGWWRCFVTLNARI